MENASKALIIAAEVLIGVLLLTILVVLFRTFGSFSNSVNDNLEIKMIGEYNAKFEVYNDRKDLTAQDVITLGNLAKQYNQSDDRNMTVMVIVSGVESKYSNSHQLSDKQSYEFIDQYSLKNKTYFQCHALEYNETTKKIDKVYLKKL